MESLGNNIKPGSLNPINASRIIPISIKLQAIEYAEKNGNHKAAIAYNVNRSTIIYWRNHKNEYNNVDNPEKRITLHNGKSPLFPDIENKLYEFFEFNRKLGNCITTGSLVHQFLVLCPDRKNDKLDTIYHIIYRFMKRHYLTIRTSTHIGQALPEESYDRMMLYLRTIIRLRRDNKINEPYLMLNADETPIFLNMPSNKTIEKIGKKTITINTQGQEKLRISCLLTISGDGTKLPPFVIFKGEKDGRIIKELNKNNHVINKNIFIGMNKNSWTTIEIINDWIKSIIIPYARNKCNNKKILLIWDRAKTHLNEDTKKLLEENSIIQVFIPPGMTRILQPLDVSINKPFKDLLKDMYIQACINAKKHIEKVKREIIINWIVDAWNNKNNINENIIKNSFLITGISNNEDGSEDYLFEGYEKLNESVIENDLDLDIEDKDSNDDDIQ